MTKEQAIRRAEKAVYKWLEGEYTGMWCMQLYGVGFNRFHSALKRLCIKHKSGWVLK